MEINSLGDPEVTPEDFDMNEPVNFTIKVLDEFECPSGSTEAYLKDIRQPGLHFRVRASGHRSFEVRRKLNGRAKRTKIGNYPGTTIEEARRQARDALSLFDKGIDPNLAKRAERAISVTLEACLKDYLESRSNLRESTSTAYDATIRQYLSDWLNRPLKDISRNLVEARHRKIGKLSQTRANTVMRILRALFNYAMAKYENELGEPVFLHNPVTRLSHVQAWYPETRKKTYLNKQQIPIWFETVESLPQWLLDPRADPITMRDYLKLILLTGLRRREASSLLWENVDLENRTLTIMEDVAKNKHEHVLPIPDYLLTLLEARNRAQNPFVFAGREENKPIAEPKRVIDAIRIKCGFHFTIHDLRRTFATVAESAGVRDYTLKRLLNHKGGRDVTAGYYVPDVNALREPMNNICNHMLEIAETYTKVSEAS